MSSMMDTLSDQARKRAREMIRNKFSSVDQLDDTGILASQLEKELNIVNAKLNSEVQSKLDSLKSAVDLMDESETKLTKLFKNITKIDEKIALTNTTISKTERLKYAHNARDNITKVMDQVKFFVNVPQRVDQLKELLSSNPLHLREVFLEALKLESLRAALMKELKVSRHRRRSMTTMTRESMDMGLQQRRDSIIGIGDYSNETKETVEKQLKVVPELVRDVKSLVLSHIDRMFDIAEENPALLVQAFEIIEMQQEYNDRRNIANERLMKDTLTEDDMKLNNSQKKNAKFFEQTGIKVELYENIHADVEQRLRDMFDRAVEGEFEREEHKLAGPKATAVRMMGTQLLTKIKYFQNSILPCIPPSYDAMFIFMEAFEFKLLPELREMLRSLADMKVSEILDIISWFEYLISSLEDFSTCSPEHPDARKPAVNEINAMKAEMMLEYKERIKSQVHQWFNNIKSRENEITKSTDNTLITSHPEDMFNIIHAQLNVAKEKLPPEYVKEVAIACLQVLQDVQRQSYDTLQHNLTSLDAETLCAIVNDNQRMEEKCREFTDEMLRYVRDNEERDMLDGIANEVATEYLLIANKAVTSIARCIIESLDEDVFSKLYTPEWESGNSDSFLTILTATFEDYFSDLSQWLAYYHYTKLQRELLAQTVGRYLMTLRKRCNGAFTFTNELVVANKIIRDRSVLIDFFKNYLEDLQRGGMRPTKYVSSTDDNHDPNLETLESALYNELEPMISLTRVITARQLSVGENDAKALFARYGGDGLRLVQACYFCNPTINRIERQQNSDKARKMYEESTFSPDAHEEYKSFDVMNYNSATGKVGENSEAILNGQSSAINNFFRMKFMGRKG